MKFTFILLSLFSTFFVCISSDKVRLSDVSTLTLYSNRKTNGRRSDGVSQLECVGGTAQCNHKYLPSVVQCTNTGTDGYDNQWRCNAELDKSVKFGSIDVSCEGYDYPNDKYVLKGSCGLRYTLDRSGNSNGNSYNTNRNEQSMGGLWIIVLIVVALVIFAYVYNTNSPGGVAGATAPPCPPAPGFRPEYTSAMPPPPAYSTINGEPKNERQGADGPGFWTGMGVGGLAGYFFGAQGAKPRHYDQMPAYTQYDNRYSGESSYSRPRSTTPETRTASGYGGTSRR